MLTNCRQPVERRGWTTFVVALEILAAVATALGARPTYGASREQGKYRQLQPGDRWSYITRGVMERDGRVLPYSQTTMVEVLNETRKAPDGTECRVLSIRTVTRSPAGVDRSTSEAYFTQSPDGTVLVRGRKPADKPEPQWVAEPLERCIPDVKSPLKVGESWSTRYKMSDNTTGEQRAEVVGVRRLRIPVGTFRCFVVRSSLQESDGLRVLMLDWYVPELGSHAFSFSLAKTAEGLRFVEAEVLVGHALSSEGKSAR
ncbi:MAG: hypothetical protein ACUVRO_07050 [Armatimonadota bacterium]